MIVPFSTPNPLAVPMGFYCLFNSAQRQLLLVQE